MKALIHRSGPAAEIEHLENRLRPDELAQWLALRRMVTAIERAGQASAAVLEPTRAETGLDDQTLRRWWRRYKSGTDKFPAGDIRTLLDTRRVAALWSKQADAAEPAPKDVPAFVADWRGRVLRHNRSIAAAYRELVREWERGDKVPGYGTWPEWFARTHGGHIIPARCPSLPLGWSERNLRHLAPPRVELLLARQGIAAAREVTPHVIGTRRDTRFLECVSFDDIRLDFKVLDPESGKRCDVWLLVAYDYACALHLGYGLRLALERPDKTYEHLTRDDSHQLIAHVLNRYGLPPYGMHVTLENGTATVDKGTARSLELATGDLLSISFASMIGGQSPVGYQERAVGNSRAKASLEATNALIHYELDGLPGQVGRDYTVRPADLKAREDEAGRIWEMAQTLPAHLRGQMRYPVLTVDQARDHLNQMFARIASRRDHSLEDFEMVPFWRSHRAAEWQPIHTMPDDLPADYETALFKESPIDRMRRLVAPYTGQWRACPAHVLAGLLNDHQRAVRVRDTGEIRLRVRERLYWYAAPGDEYRIAPGTEVIVHTDKLHLDHIFIMDASGRVLGVWPQREAVRRGDQEALSAALRYTGHALKTARTAVAEAAAPQRAALEAMREHNAALLESVPAAERLAIRDNIEAEEPGDDLPVAPGIAGIHAARRLAKAERDAAPKRARAQQDLVEAAEAALDAKTHNL